VTQQAVTSLTDPNSPPDRPGFARRAAAAPGPASCHHPPRGACARWRGLHCWRCPLLCIAWTSGAAVTRVLLAAPPAVRDGLCQVTASIGPWQPPGLPRPTPLHRHCFTRRSQSVPPAGWRSMGMHCSVDLLAVGGAWRTRSDQCPAVPPLRHAPHPPSTLRCHAMRMRDSCNDTRYPCAHRPALPCQAPSAQRATQPPAPRMQWPAQGHPNHRRGCRPRRALLAAVAAGAS
jgi:hypothetical protein